MKMFFLNFNFQKNLLVGGVTGLGVVTLTFLFPLNDFMEFHRILIGVIAGIYIGFAINEGNSNNIIVEILLALFIFVMTLASAHSKLAVLIPIAYTVHGCWDWLHHKKTIKTPVVQWYPPFCAAVDFVLAVSILMRII